MADGISIHPRIGWETWEQSSGGFAWWEAHEVNARPSCGWAASPEEAWTLCQRRAKRVRSTATLYAQDVDGTVRVKARMSWQTA